MKLVRVVASGNEAMDGRVDDILVDMLANVLVCKDYPVAVEMAARGHWDCLTPQGELIYQGAFMM